MKEQIFGLNAARVFGVDVNATRNAAAQGLPQPDQDGLPRGGACPKPPLVRMGYELSGTNIWVRETVVKKITATKQARQLPGTRFEGRRKPFPGDLTAAIQAADTLGTRTGPHPR